MLPCGSSGLPGTYPQEKPELLLKDRYEQPHCPCLALLPTGVAWPNALLRPPVVSYTTFSPSPGEHRLSPAFTLGGLFLWPDPADSSAPGVTRRCALWSADFPPDIALQYPAIARPTWAFASYHIPATSSMNFLFQMSS
jgi:hypothetical protein